MSVKAVIKLEIIFRTKNRFQQQPKDGAESAFLKMNPPQEPCAMALSGYIESIVRRWTQKTVKEEDCIVQDDNSCEREVF